MNGKRKIVILYICLCMLLLGCGKGSLKTENYKNDKGTEETEKELEKIQEEEAQEEEKSFGAYAIVDEPDIKSEYLMVKKDGKEYYIRRPDDRTEDSYLIDEGAFQFETPRKWLWGSCDLDVRLQAFYKSSGDVPCLLWGVEDNDMGANAFSENWEEVCASIERTAETVFEENLTKVVCEKYQLEDGQDVYAFWCNFTDKKNKPWIVSAAYRLGEKNLLEFMVISRERDNKKDTIKNLALYTAATYEEYDGERYREYEGYVRYKGMKAWDYEKLHNPMALAYEQANGEVWRSIENSLTEADQEIEWKENILPEALKEALGIKDRELTASDLLQVDYLELVERGAVDFCYINEEVVYVNWNGLESGDALIQDLVHLKNLTALYLEIGDISDFSPIGELENLEVLSIKAGRAVKDVSFLDRLQNLQILKLQKAPQQMSIDSWADDLWERTCREMEFTTFSREYDGEKGTAFDGLDLSGYLKE